MLSKTSPGHSSTTREALLARRRRQRLENLKSAGSSSKDDDECTLNVSGQVMTSVESDDTNDHNDHHHHHHHHPAAAAAAAASAASAAAVMTDTTVMDAQQYPQQEQDQEQDQEQEPTFASESSEGEMDRCGESDRHRAFRMTPDNFDIQNDLFSSRPVCQQLTPDPSCIPYHSMIMIAHSASSTCTNRPPSLRYLAAVDPHNNSSYLQPATTSASSYSSYSSSSSLTVDMSGKGLSQPYECLIVQPADDNNNNNNRTKTHYVQCGDIVSLHSPANHNQTLGVRRKKNFHDDEHEEEFDVTFSHHLLGTARQWIVLSGNRPGRVITLHSNPTTHTHHATSLDKTLVRVGQPLILLNVHTGGILSVHENKLTILTTMYQRKQIDSSIEPTATTTSSSSSLSLRKSTLGKDLLQFLNEHLHITISSREIFSWIPVHIPPIPSWATSNSLIHERVYLNGFFLQYPHRFDTTTQDRRIHMDFAHSVHYQNLDTLAQQSIQVQDKVLIDDLIGAMMGLEGNTIRAFSSIHPDPTRICNVTFQIIAESATGGSLDTSLRNLVLRLLPTCDAFVQVRAFVSVTSTKYEVGKISHALCGAIDSFLQQYLEIILEMEDRYRHSTTNSSPFPMSQFFAECQQVVETMHILSCVVSRVKDVKGGRLLNYLYELMMEYSGNETAQDIFSHLMEISSIPYFDMLTQWLQGGFLQDPYGEFMIHQTHLGSLDQQNFILYEEDWPKWYRLRPDHVFHTLTASRNDSLDSDSTIQKILLAGKYWNAVSLCNDRSVPDIRYGSKGKRGVFDHSQSWSLTYQTLHADIRTFVNNCFEDASKTLYNIMMRDYQLVDVLRFTKSYFLLDQGDFFIHFMDMAEDELLQAMPEVSKGRVGAWAKYSLQLGKNFPDISSQDSGTSSKTLKNIAASLQCDFATESLVEALDHLHAASGNIHDNEPKTPSRHLYGGGAKGLTGIEAFMLSYGKRFFPLSLFLSTRTIYNYQLLFRHIFFAKHVERRLVGTWLDHQMMKDFFHSLRKEMGPTYCLRHRMLHFVQTFVNYMMSDVFEPNWARMESQILSSSDPDSESSITPIRTVDDILKIHNDFVRTSLKECLLTNRDLVRTFTKLLTTCLLFSDQMKLFMETTHIWEERHKTALEERHKRDQKQLLQSFTKSEANKQRKMKAEFMNSQQKRKQRIEEQIVRLRRELSTDSYKKMIGRFEQVFHSHLTEFMSLLSKNSDGHYNTHLFNLCIRLDYNRYVSHVIEK